MASRPPPPPPLYDAPSEALYDRFSEENATDSLRTTPQLEAGLDAIRNVAKTLPARPGVYRMLNMRGDVLYVGKARNLKARVTSYTQPNRLPNRIVRMVAQTKAMTIVTTATEADALLLEANLIKRFRPPYNVLLRDDKSFPYIFLREDHSFAQISKHRGARKGKGQFYGPFASTQAVNQTLNTLQKVFLLRSCSDSVFENRSRPCLLHQIKRCSAPCVQRVSQTEYAQTVRHAKAFLSGKSSEAQKHLATQMQEASSARAFERAAALRDRLKALSYVQNHHGTQTDMDADIIALAMRGGSCCIQIFFLRGGQNWGNRALFPRVDAEHSAEDILSAFIAQFYEDKPPPRHLCLDRPLPNSAVLADALSGRATHRVHIATPQRGALAEMMALAQRNAIEALDRKHAEAASQERALEDVARVFHLAHRPNRIEVYDNSHIQGTHAVGAMIVAGPQGFIKNSYRKFTIREAIPGDDFGMMREVLTRRCKALLDTDRSAWPDLLLIDGGAGQRGVAQSVFEVHGIDNIPIIGIAKGPDRHAGREVFYLPDGTTTALEPNTAALFFLQRLRDEAHRFAIGAHRQKRAKAVDAHALDDVPGIGPQRKKALLAHFGSASAVRTALCADLKRVEGISDTVAQAIFDYFHPEGA